MKKQARRRALSLLLSLLVILLSTTCASAEEGGFRNNASFLQEYRTAADRLFVYCANTSENGALPQQVEVTLNNTALPVSGIRAAEQEEHVYYCLVDVSGSITYSQMAFIKQTLNDLCDTLEKGDRVVIATLGDTLSASAYLNDPEQIREEIANIKTTGQNTNFYRGLTDALQELASTKQTGRKTLLLISDGGDVSTVDDGFTKEEAERKITESRLPVYVVIPPGTRADLAKQIASLARLSVGGEVYTYEGARNREGTIAEEIRDDLKRDLILELDLSGFQSANDELLLTVSISYDDGNRYGDTLTVYSQNLELTPPAPSPTPPPSPEPPIPPPTPTPVPGIGELILKWGALPAAFLALFVILLLVLFARKRRRADETQNETVTTHTVEVKEEIKNNGEDILGSGRDIPNAFFHDPVRRRLRFTVVGSTDYAIEFELEEGVTLQLGRDSRADLPLNPTDTRLSGRHCFVRLNGNTLTVWDAGSTNGTSVNDVPLQGNRVELENEDTLTAGSYKYRVQFLNE